MTGMSYQKMIYGIKYDGKPGEIIKIKGLRPTCWKKVLYLAKKITSTPL